MIVVGVFDISSTTILYSLGIVLCIKQDFNKYWRMNGRELEILNLDFLKVT